MSEGPPPAGSESAELRSPPPGALLSIAIAAALATLASGCGHTTCATSDDPACRTPSPCTGLHFECSGGSVSVARYEEGQPVPVTGLDALVSPGDVVLRSDRVVAVIDAIDHPHYVAPTGGNVLDLAAADGTGDSLTHLFQAVGLLPDDTIAYDQLFLDSRDGVAAVEVRGRLAGKPDARVVTRYELRPCEPGLRVRTEIVNGRDDAETWALVDAWYWSGREALPFAPGPGTGFEQEGFRSPLRDSWQRQAYFAAASHSDPAMSYGEIACGGPLFGFHAEQLSAVGPEPRVVPSRDVEVFERFLAVTPGRSISGPIDTLLEVRRQVEGEAWTELSGRVDLAGGGLVTSDARVTLRIEEGSAASAASARTPWTQVTPAADGTWTARVPANRDYVVTADAFGREAGHASVHASGASTTVDAIPIAAAATVNATVTVDGAPDHALVFVVPADDATEEATRAQLLGGYVECAPLLGPSTGGSPACDRVLVFDTASFELPPGHWDLVATAGPFATLAREEITVAAGDEEDVTLAIRTLEVAPDATLSSDFHVHGAASFDSTVPEIDRVQAFLASRIDVIAATDHDVVWDYEAGRTHWNADERLQLLVGLEATGHILFDLVPGAELPQVIGHWNVWPLAFDVNGPYRGAPWDELCEPGTLMTRFVEAGWPADTGIVQLNHPWAPSQVGRDLGFPRAVGVNANEPLPRTDMSGYDDTGPGLVLRTPPGASFGNADYQTQEVMNGTENEELQSYRAYWFYLLDQGIVRAGTANSDSHSLVDNVLGTPRTLVTTDQHIGPTFDQVAFNRAVREGRMIGTNGPVIEASIEDRSGAARTPSVEPFVPHASPMLSIRVTAAPWVPVDEVRIVVNGEVARTIAAELSHPDDPFGQDGVVRFEGEVALSELGLDGTRDAWIVVEAGEAMPIVGDLDCDAIPDTGDNDGSGTVDWRDVDRNGDDVVDARDTAGLTAAPACERGADIGPVARTPRGPRTAARWGFGAVTPHGYAYGFTNPLLVDWDGDGFEAPGVRGAR
ncbi:MAG: CehA/McbA family metallohydrolase [Sandaracinus sp.]